MASSQAQGLYETEGIHLILYDGARTRYRVFGRYERCLMPRPEFRNRFVD
jgi:predicted DCC family thiol-disulfide oxidoreductase YuxK